MSNAALLHVLEQWAAPPGGAPDPILLGRFLADHDGDAFTATLLAERERDKPDDKK